MKIYTKTGDKGETGLFGGARVSKASDRVDAYGEVDELNSVLGLARAQKLDPDTDTLLAQVQSTLFNLGAELATDPESKVDVGVPAVQDADIEPLEKAIDRCEAELAPLKAFVLPGGSEGAATLHLARTVCRRAERRLVALAADTALRPECIRYLNRLSDLLFVLARYQNHVSGVQDVPWEGAGRHKA